ncbi:unnamed protein product [Ectocarpus sp. 12 AP-2014]
MMTNRRVRLCCSFLLCHPNTAIRRKYNSKQYFLLCSASKVLVPAREEPPLLTNPLTFAQGIASCGENRLKAYLVHGFSGGGIQVLIFRDKVYFGYLEHKFLRFA